MIFLSRSYEKEGDWVTSHRSSFHLGITSDSVDAIKPMNGLPILLYLYSCLYMLFGCWLHSTEVLSELW